jgi:hypothetical protein
VKMWTAHQSTDWPHAEHSNESVIKKSSYEFVPRITLEPNPSQEFLFLELRT